MKTDRILKLNTRIVSWVTAVIMVGCFPAISFGVESDSSATDTTPVVNSTQGENTAVPVDLSGMTEETAMTDELLVLAQKGTSKGELKEAAAGSGASLENVNTMDDGTKMAKISFDDPDEAQTIADELISREEILLVQPNYIYRIDREDEIEPGEDQPAAEIASEESDGTDRYVVLESSSTSDLIEGTNMLKQWYTDTGYTGSTYGQKAWESLTPSTTKAKVAVIDTGADLDHSDLSGVIIKNECITYNYGKKGSFTAWDNAYDDEGHGTHVSGIIAAQAGDQYGITGLGYDRVSLIVIDADLPDNRGFTTQDIVNSINYAVDKNVDVINMSLGGLGRDYLIEGAVESATEKNVLCVCAAGNESTDLTESPGDIPAAISVMAHDKNGSKASFSNYGYEKDVSAPGRNVLSTLSCEESNGKHVDVYGYKSGTSMAAPVVSGMAALIISEDPSLQVRQVKNYIYTSSGSRSFSETKSGFGFGRVNESSAINALQSSASAPSGIVLNRDSKTMYPGEAITLEYAVYPATASIYADQTTFSSSDPSVARVDSSGRVSANASGQTVITASCKGKSATCTITVKDIPYENVTGLPYTKTGYFSPADPTLTVTYQKQVWEAMVDGYVLPPLAEGKTAQIKVTTSEAVPFLKAFDPAGDQIEMDQVVNASRNSDSYVLTASFIPTERGRYKLQVMGETLGDNTVNRKYTLKIDGTPAVQSTPASTVTGPETSITEPEPEVTDPGSPAQEEQTKPAKKTNPIKVKGKTASVKYSKLKKKNRTISRSKVISISHAKGRVTYAKISGNKKIRINRTTGKITIKKNLKKGRYKVKVRVSAAGNPSYKAANKRVTITIRVR